MAAAHGQFPAGTRIYYNTVRVVKEENHDVRMKQDGIPDNCLERILLRYNKCARCLPIKMLLDSINLLVFLGCFYMISQDGSPSWLYPLFWVDYFFQIVAFYFYFKYPSKFDIQAFTLWRTSVYVQELVLLLVKPVLLWTADVGDTPGLGLLGSGVGLLVLCATVGFRGVAAYDSSFSLPNCVTLVLWILRRTDWLSEISTNTVWSPVLYWNLILLWANETMLFFWVIIFLVGKFYPRKVSFYNLVLCAAFGYQAWISTLLPCVLTNADFEQCNGWREINYKTPAIACAGLSLLSRCMQICYRDQGLFMNPVDRFKRKPALNERVLRIRKKVVQFESQPSAILEPLVYLHGNQPTAVNGQENEQNYDYPERVSSQVSGNNIGGSRTSLRSNYLARIGAMGEQPGQEGDVLRAVPASGNLLKLVGGRDQTKRGTAGHQLVCPLCGDRALDGVFVPCMHAVGCFTCVKELGRNDPSCLYCQQPAIQIARLKPVKADQYEVVEELFTGRL